MPQHSSKTIRIEKTSKLPGEIDKFSTRVNVFEKTCLIYSEEKQIKTKAVVRIN